jgi:hypothetical protein
MKLSVEVLGLIFKLIYFGKLYRQNISYYLVIMDIDKLLSALDNDNNNRLINLTKSKINNMKIEILNELYLSQNEINDYMKKLQDYLYVDELDHLKEGAYIRWIPINDPNNIYLTQGGILCEPKITDNGIILVCKNFARRHYEIKMEECIIFQKLTNQEQVLLSALDYLNK